MKTNILSQMGSTAAAAILLASAAFAQDSSSLTGRRDQALGADLSNSPGQMPGTGLFDAGGGFAGQPNQSPQARSFSTGVIVKDGATYVVHRLQNEMSLPDGSKVEPNGVIRNSDGSARNFDPSQMLSIDGRVMASPFGMGGVTNPGPQPNTGVGPATSTTPTVPNPDTSVPNSSGELDTQNFLEGRSGTPPSSEPGGNPDLGDELTD